MASYTPPLLFHVFFCNYSHDSYYSYNTPTTPTPTPTPYSYSYYCHY